MATPARFRLARRLLAPRWLTEGDGGLIGYTLDLMKDAFVERLRLGHLARYPQQDPFGTPAPDDALTEMGRDRRVVKGLNESSAAYAVRLKRWLDDRRKAGTARMLLRKLAEYTGPGPSWRVVDVRGNWYSRDGAGVESQSLQQNNWFWDIDSERWSRFWVVCYPNGLWSSEPLPWGDPTDTPWGANPTTDMLGATATQEQVAALKHIVRDWKPDGTRCVNIILAFDPTSFDPTAPEPNGTWGHHSRVVGGVRVRSRLATARYIDGV